MEKIKFMLIACLMVFIATESFAGGRKANKNIETAVFQADEMCKTCEKKILEYIPFQKGIKDVEVNLENQTVTVRYDKRKSSPKAIIALLAKLDIKAVQTKAEPTTEKKCSKGCC